MAINLVSKYSDQIAEVFTRASFIKGKTAETFDLTGVKTLKVYTPITVEEVDYDRDGGLARYGDVAEMQDVVQELTMTQDKAFTLTIDKGNNLDQNLVKNAADMLRLQPVSYTHLDVYKRQTVRRPNRPRRSRSCSKSWTCDRIRNNPAAGGVHPLGGI